MSNLFQRLLDYYHIDEQTYRYMNRDIDPSIFSNRKFDKMEEAVEFLKDHIKRKSKIIIYGDYDADGICSSSIILKMLMYVDYLADVFIPSRYLDGYGINLDNAKIIVEKKYDLVICVDNGIAANEAIDYLRENGVEVLVLDHHEIPEVLPKANFILHPTFSHYGDIASSAGFVTFIFSINFLNRFDKYLSVLAALSLVSDMMPLLDYNRDLLRYVLSNFKVGEFLPIDLINNNEILNEEKIGMSIAPKINSIGRVIEQREGANLVKFLTSDDKEFVLNYIGFINEINEQRKNLSKEFSDDIKKDNDYCICEVANTKEGIIGLIANKMVNEYQIPCIIFAKDEEKGIYKGSARAPIGFNMFDAMKALEKHFLTFGGHAQAGGCSVEINKFESFKKDFIKYCEHHKFEAIPKDTFELYLSDLNFDNYELIKSFGPFGEGWKKPTFLIKNIRVSALNFSKDNNHIITNIGVNSKIVGFYMHKSLVTLYDRIDIEGSLKTSQYKGRISLDFSIEKYSKSKI